MAVQTSLGGLSKGLGVGRRERSQTTRSGALGVPRARAKSAWKGHAPASLDIGST